MRQAFSAVLLFTILFLTGCDRDRASLTTPINNDPAPSTTPTGPGTLSKVRLYFFAGGFCGPCKEELPEVQKWLDTRMADKADRILPSMIFTAGDPATKPATQEDADKFKNDLGLKFEAIADKYGRKYYRKYYPEGSGLPATVLLTENLDVIKVYPREKVNLSVLEADVLEALKTEKK